MLAIVEVNLTIICACVPSLKPLASRISHTLTEGTDPPKDIKQKADQQEQPEMMEILTRPEQQRRRQATREPYPRRIKLLNLLNLRPRRMLRLDSKQSIPPNAFVTLLFSLWGTAYGLLNVLGEKFDLARIGPWKTYTVQGAYYLGYFPIPLLVGRLILKRSGFGSAFILGLYIYAGGALLFWPSAILVSFPLSLISNFVIGSGLGVLELTANLYIAICGPLEYSEIRLCFAQAFQGLGSLASRLMADKVFLPHAEDVSGIIRVQWVYLAIALFNVVLAICFYYIPVPEAMDKELYDLSQLRPEANNAMILGVPVIYITLFWGVWSQFFETAGNEVHATSLPNFMQKVMPK